MSTFIAAVASKTERIAVLDGLRAMAIILVLMRHLIRPFWTDLEAPFLKLGPVEFGSAFINGWMGVDLFFVLSGYLISMHLLGRYFNSPSKGMHLKIYFKRRFLRIAPAYYFVLTVAVLGLFPFYPYPEIYDHIGWRYIYHLLFMQDYLPSNIVGVFWSLAIEIKFYLLAPFILMTLLKLPRPAWRASAVVLLLFVLPLLRFSAAMVHPEIDNFEKYFENMRSIFHLTLDGLLAGMLCAFIHQDKNLRRFTERPVVANILFFTGFGLFLFFSFFYGPLVDTSISLFDKTLLLSFIAGAFAMMLLGLMGGCLAGKFFGWRGWFPVALISYSLYLFHLPLMYPAEVLCRSFFSLDAYSAQLMMLIYTPFFLSLSVLVATLSYFFLERPFLQKK